MAYVKGNRYDGQSRVARASQNKDQVNGPPPVLATNQPILVVTFDYPNPVRLPARTHSALYDPGRNAFAPVVAGGTVQPVDQPNPASLDATRLAQNRAARSSSSDDQIGNAFNPAGIAQATTVTEPVDQPNPTRLAARAYAVLYDAEVNPGAFATGFGVTLTQQTDWPNPVSLEAQRFAQSRVARLASGEDQIGNAFSPAAVAQAITVNGQADCPNPVRLAARAATLYEPGTNAFAPAIAAQPPTVTYQNDWPNPTLVKPRASTLTDPGRNAFAPVLATNQPILVTTFDYPNPTRLVPRTHSALYDPGRTAVNPPAAIAPPVAVLLDWPNPVIRQNRTHSALYDPGVNAFLPAGVAQATTVTNQVDWQNPVRRAARAASYDAGTSAFAPTPTGGTVQPVDQPNPLTRPVRQYEAGVSAVPPTAVPPMVNECAAPVRRRVVRPGLYEPGTNPFTAGQGQTLTSQGDWPNPTLRPTRRSPTVYDPGTNAVAPVQAVNQPTTVLRHDWPNPTLRARRLHPAVTSTADVNGKVLGNIARDLAYTVALMDSRWSATVLASRWAASLEDE